MKELNSVEIGRREMEKIPSTSSLELVGESGAPKNSERF